MSKTNNKKVITSAISKPANADNSKVTDSRFSVLKTYAVLITIIVIALIIAINAVLDLIFGEQLTIDLSATAQNTISSVSVDYIDSLPADTEIRIVALMDKPTSLANSPYEYIVPLLDDYEYQSDGKITVEYINPEVYPTILTELDPTNANSLEAGMFVMTCAGRISTFYPSDCFTYDQDYLQTYGSYYPTSNIVESTFTNAIVSVTSTLSQKAYFVTGLQEDTHTSFTNILNSLFIESEDLPISDSFTVPEDCDLLIINGPLVDISTNVADAIIDYINNGGKVVVSVDFYYAAAESFPNLNTVVNTMNLNIDNSLVVENDSSYRLDDNGFSFLATVDSEFSTFTSSTTLKVAYSRPIRALDSTNANITVAPICYTTQNTALYSVVDEELVQGSATGQFNAAMYAYNSSTDAEMFVFGASSFTSDTYISSYGFSDPNVELVRSMLRSALDVQNSLVVESKQFADYSVNDDAATGSNATFMIIIFMIVIPLAFVITASVVYKKRKNL